jgi:hypothetical protein
MHNIRFIHLMPTHILKSKYHDKKLTGVILVKFIFKKTFRKP